MTNEHTSLEKRYLSHFIQKGCERVAKGLCVRGELETEQTATYWPQVPLTIAALLSHSAGLLNKGSWGPKPSAGSWFSLPRTATRTPTNWLQLTLLSVAPGYIIVWRPPASRGRHNCTKFNLSMVKVVSWYLQLDAPAFWLKAASKVKCYTTTTLHGYEMQFRRPAKSNGLYGRMEKERVSG